MWASLLHCVDGKVSTYTSFPSLIWSQQSLFFGLIGDSFVVVVIRWTHWSWCCRGVRGVALAVGVEVNIYGGGGHGGVYWYIIRNIVSNTRFLYLLVIMNFCSVSGVLNKTNCETIGAEGGGMVEKGAEHKMFQNSTDVWGWYHFNAADLEGNIVELVLLWPLLSRQREWLTFPRRCHCMLMKV